MVRTRLDPAKTIALLGRDIVEPRFVLRVQVRHVSQLWRVLLGASARTRSDFSRTLPVAFHNSALRANTVVSMNCECLVTVDLYMSQDKL